MKQSTTKKNSPQVLRLLTLLHASNTRSFQGDLDLLMVFDVSYYLHVNYTLRFLSFLAKTWADSYSACKSHVISSSILRSNEMIKYDMKSTNYHWMSVGILFAMTATKYHYGRYYFKTIHNNNEYFASWDLHDSNYPTRWLDSSLCFNEIAAKDKEKCRTR